LGKVKPKEPITVGKAIEKAHRPLYHYTDTQCAISILETKTFRMSDPANFNDPYDCRLKVKNAHLVNDCYERIGHEVRNSLLGTPSLLENKPSFIKVKQAASLHPSGSVEISLKGRRILKSWISESIARHDNAVNKAAALARIGARVACFCQSGTKLPQWGYYGESGKGVCLVFDFDTNVWETSLLEVEYRERIPNILSVWNWLEIMFNLRKLHEIIGVEEFVRTLIKTKSKDWAHENEVRFAGIQDATVQESATFLLHDREILGILVGFAISSKDYADIKKIARKMAIPYGQVKMRDQEYELFFD
jgi:hypothetical protein